MNISRRNPVSSPSRKSLRSILTSYVVIRVFLGHPIYLFPSDYPIETFYTFSSPPIHSHSSPISFNLVLLGVINKIRNKNWCRANKMLQCLCKLQSSIKDIDLNISPLVFHIIYRVAQKNVYTLYSSISLE